jgi:hypothetical protein
MVCMYEKKDTGIFFPIFPCLSGIDIPDIIQIDSLGILLSHASLQK